ncbi:MAG: glycosyltransferase family 1 protein [Pseudomonadota bacterium]
MSIGDSAMSLAPANRTRLHLGVVTETYPPEVNGVAMTIGRLVDEMSRRGHRIQLVRPRQGQGDTVADALDDEFDTPLSTTLVSGVTMPWYRELRLGLPAGSRLRQLWRRERPDVLYVATEGLLGWSAIREAARQNIPVISGFHTNFHSYSQHYQIGFLQRPIYDYLRRLHNRTACTLVPTEVQRKSLLADRFRNVEVLGRGVDSRLFTPARRNEDLRRAWGLGRQDLAVIYVGRLAAEKNLPLAVHAFRAMRERNPNLRLIIVGDGPFYEDLYGNERDVIFCGVQTGVALAEHYASADIFLFPSETETFGNVTLEAMASGLAVVAFDYAAAHMHIEPKQEGLLVPLGDHAAFIATAAALATQPERVEQLRFAARRKAQRLDWQGVADRFEWLLRTYSGRA